MNINDKLIIKSGTNLNGSWIKFADGTMICTRKYTINSTVGVAWGNIFVSSKKTGTTFPVSFVSPPIVTMMAEGIETVWLIGASMVTNTKSMDFYICAGLEPSGAKDITINVQAIGRWK